MQDGDIDITGLATLPRPAGAIDDSDAGGWRAWRDDLRLFALTWAAGFLFFMILLA